MKFRIVLRRIHFRRSMRGQGSDEVLFLARAGGVSFNLRGLKADVTHVDHYDFPEASGSVEVDSGKAKEITMRFSCMSTDGHFDHGEITHTLSKPFKPRDERLNTTNYVLDWTVETALGRGAPKDIRACRQEDSSITCTTASGSEFPLELEAHCVIPSPVHKPGKFTISKWASSIRNQGPIFVSPGDPINVIPNPSAVPLLDPGDANAGTGARIQATYYK
ncbi:MAG: hypothetical protein IID40_00065, partial [Planctomycetes bacterium]|nr:hypothetical protein [Planctomycetota bacterium]